MARGSGRFGGLGRFFKAVAEGITDAINKVIGPPAAPKPPPRTPPPPPRKPPPIPPGGGGSDDYGMLERRALNNIDSFQLERMPDRIDANGKRWPAEYNRDRVADQLRELPGPTLRGLASMNRDEFRAWSRSSGFFYH